MSGAIWSWMLLALGLLCCWATSTAIVRLNRPAAFGLGTMMTSWLVGEFPLIHVVWEAAALWLFAWFGALDQWPGVVGAVLVVTEAGGVVADAAGLDLVVLDPAERRTPVAATSPELLEALLVERRR